jgi:competence protein ComEC
VKTRTLIALLWLFALIYWNVYVWSALLGTSQQLLTVAFLDVGQGDSIFIQAPNGHQMLIDGGRDEHILAALQQMMPRGDTDIDVVLATHPDADHIGGLPAVLERYEVTEIIDNGKGGKDTKVFDEFNTDITLEQARYVHAMHGMRVILDREDGVYFDVLYPTASSTSPDTNDMSIVGRLVYGQHEFMLTGDSPTAVESKLVEWCSVCLRSDVLKAGHHGSRTSTGQDFLDAVDPQYVVISAGKDNSYGHPHKEVIDRLLQKGVSIQKTTELGSVVFVSDGEKLWIK